MCSSMPIGGVHASLPQCQTPVLLFAGREMRFVDTYSRSSGIDYFNPALMMLMLPENTIISRHHVCF